MTEETDPQAPLELDAPVEVTDEAAVEIVTEAAEIAIEGDAGDEDDNSEITAAIAASMDIVAGEMTIRYGWDGDTLPIAIMGLGKLGGGGIDYDSDLDVIAVYDDSAPTPPGIAVTEFYARVVEASSTRCRE